MALIAPANIQRIETNLQIAHAPKSAVRDFRTDYMMKVFDYHAESGTFDEGVMELASWSQQLPRVAAAPAGEESLSISPQDT